MNPPSLNVESLALYGSTARGDSDFHSDCDILLVDDCVTRLFATASILRHRGYSCATYTWSSLEHMAAHGSLFIQHLRTEAVILSDRRGRLGAFLQAYSPLADYSRDIDSTRDVIALTETMANCRQSVGWACDVLAVAVRNIGILSLANEGRYAFSFDSVLCGLRDIGTLISTDIAILRTLRAFKSHYRARRYESLPTLREFQSIHRVVTRRFRVDLDMRVYATEALPYIMIDRAGKHRSKYCRLRLAEGAAARCICHALRTPPELVAQYHRILTRQNQYGLISHDIANRLQRISRQIIDHEYGQEHIPRYH